MAGKPRGIHPSTIELNGYKIHGVSSAGIGTCLTIPQLKVCFDTAQGLPYAYAMKHFLVTHAHQDHAGGVPYILSQKAMTDEKGSVFYMPDSLVEPMSQIIGLWNQVEGYDCPFHFTPTEYEKEFPLQGEYFFKIFKTHHRVQSNGYTVFKRKKKLKEEYIGLEPQELAELGKAGTDLHRFIDTPEISFTGDTKIEFLDTCPWILQSKILIMEVTYAGPSRSIERARQWGHIHFDEVLPRLGDIQSEHIVFIHRSSRYTKKEFSDFVYDAVSEKDKKRIHIFP